MINFICIDVNAADSNGDTPLILALRLPYRQYKNTFLTLLLSNGADINIKNAKGLTALHYASIRQNIEQIVFLAEHGAHVFAVDEKQRLPVDYLKQV